MTARETLQHLGVTRKTLDNYVKRGLIRMTKYQIPHRMGWNNYDDSDVYALIGRGLRSKDRTIIAYVRAKGESKEADAKIEEQKKRILAFVSARGISTDEIFEDRSDSMATDYSLRPGLSDMMEQVLRNEVAAIVLDTKCRLSRFAFHAYEHLFKYHGVEVIIINKVLGDPYYQAEQAEDIARVLHEAKIARLGD
jgi:predicted site-specific integrase-resolvase